MAAMWELLVRFWETSGFAQAYWGNLVMIGVGLLFLYLAIRKGFEPLLLVPIGFGILVGNVPYNVSNLSIGVTDGPVSEEELVYYTTDQPVTIEGVEVPPWTRFFPPQDSNDPPARRYLAKDLVDQGRAVMVHAKSLIAYSGPVERPGVLEVRQGRRILAVEPSPEGRYPAVVTPKEMDPWNAGVYWFFYRGVAWGMFPPLIFLGIGALTDFGPLLANPRLILLGAAAQIGIFGTLIGALLLGFSLREAAAIGIIGGADGPTSIFVCTQLAPNLLGAVALAGYSYMALVPIIQPPIMKLLTTPEERRIRMEPPGTVSKTARIAFPIVGFLLTAFLANGALPLLSMLFFGNLLRESLVTERLAKTASTSFIDIVTILLGLTVGAKTRAGEFLTWQTISIFVLGMVAFALSTAGGVLFAKLMNLVSQTKINPLIGAAGVSAVPMAARVAHKVAQESDPQNFVLMHAMGPNVAGVIGSAVAAGVLLSYFG
ncbi:sodium ion-translocating decarboxylase, beta subunit [Isosphaera pallida ATCC 43644]|uniref:Sodium ion-translocating decarboxylase, beta subunit n=2 Tax=Isosphaera pallida TaxID=128 RepID=E8QZN3_ISOPI|nr:sodium ion-translocating decarboxylase subunit beta [Isosphaera pallida]ADV62169.1 sodium ion-translocating decarboxylase, beta subunit [Isosphaera pallida ATCC 43644]